MIINDSDDVVPSRILVMFVIYFIQKKIKLSSKIPRRMLFTTYTFVRQVKNTIHSDYMSKVLMQLLVLKCEAFNAKHTFSFGNIERYCCREKPNFYAENSIDYILYVLALAWNLWFDFPLFYLQSTHSDTIGNIAWGKMQMWNTYIFSRENLPWKSLALRLTWDESIPLFDPRETNVKCLHWFALLCFVLVSEISSVVYFIYRYIIFQSFWTWKTPDAVDSSFNCSLLFFINWKNCKKQPISSKDKSENKFFLAQETISLCLLPEGRKWQKWQSLWLEWGLLALNGNLHAEMQCFYHQFCDKVYAYFFAFGCSYGSNTFNMNSRMRASTKMRYKTHFSK